jgi:hypothetical protein
MSDPAVLSERQLESFIHDGYLIVPDLFDPTLAVEARRTDVQNHLNNLVVALTAHSNAADAAESGAPATRCERLSDVEAALPGFATIMHKTAWAGPALRRIWGNERVVAAVRQLLTAADPQNGGTRAVAAHPAFNLRCKIPAAAVDETTVPWHQDVAYVMSREDVTSRGFDSTATALSSSPGDEGQHGEPQRSANPQVSTTGHERSSSAATTMQLTMWVPLVDMLALEAAELTLATQRAMAADGNEVALPAPSSSGALAGPLQVLPGPWVERFRAGDAPVLPHVGCEAGTWYLYIPDAELREAAAASMCPPVTCGAVPLGGAVFFTGYTPHRSLPNVLHATGATRWTADFRFQFAGLPTGCDADALPLTDTDGRILVNPDWEQLQCCRPVDPVSEAERRNIEHDCGSGGTAGGEPSYLQPVIGGPWMDAWPMPTATRHVQAYRSGHVAFPMPRYAPAGSLALS